MHSAQTECGVGCAILVGSMELGIPIFRMTVFEALVWLFGVVAVGCLAVLALSRLCRRWLGTATSTNVTFSVVALRQMRDRGEVTTTEYEALVRKLYLAGGENDKVKSRGVSDKLGRGARPMKR